MRSDSVDHDSRLRILSQVRAVISEEGWFAFSSHSLDALSFGIQLPRLAASTPLPVAQFPPAERFFRVSLFLLLLTAILTLIGTGKIDLFTSILATIGLAQL